MLQGEGVSAAVERRPEARAGRPGDPPAALCRRLRLQPALCRRHGAGPDHVAPVLGVRIVQRDGTRVLR